MRSSLFLEMAVQAVITVFLFYAGLTVNAGQQAIAALIFFVLSFVFSLIEKE